MKLPKEVIAAMCCSTMKKHRCLAATSEPTVSRVTTKLHSMDTKLFDAVPGFEALKDDLAKK